MTFRALNNREELDKAVIAAQARFDLLARLMADLQRLQSRQCHPSSIGLIAMEADKHADWLRVHLDSAIRRAAAMTEAGMIPARPIPNPDLTFDAGKAEPWVADDRRQA